MVGMRASARGSVPHQQAATNIRACLDLVEQLVRQSENVKLPEVETTLNVLNLWLDGQHITYVVVPSHSSVGNTQPLDIGRKGPVTGQYWKGAIDDVRIWNVIRTGDQIAAAYRQELTGLQLGLVGNWKFDEGRGTLAVDSA